MDKVDCIVAGAGVVGLAIARKLARAGREVVVLESTGGIGNGTSSRNSEVIHAGIYYPTGSLMAKLCVRGKRALYEYCDSHGVPTNRCGKLIVATSAAEVEKLDAIKSQRRQTTLRTSDSSTRPRRKHWSRHWPARRHCCHHRPASSTATP